MACNMYMYMASKADDNVTEVLGLASTQGAADLSSCTFRRRRALTGCWATPCARPPSALLSPPYRTFITQVLTALALLLLPNLCRRLIPWHATAWPDPARPGPAGGLDAVA